jgi:hypothetical protein
MEAEMKKYIFFTFLFTSFFSHTAITEISFNLINKVSQVSAYGIARSMATGGYIGAQYGMKAAQITCALGTMVGALIPTVFAIGSIIKAKNIQPSKSQYPYLEHAKRIGYLFFATSIALGFKYLIDQAEFF